MEESKADEEVIEDQNVFTNEENDNTNEHNGFSDVLRLDELPDVVLVGIFQNLSLKEQYYLSLVNRRFYDVFNHPSLWHTISIHLMHLFNDKWGRTSNTIVPEKYVQLINQFGKYFQNLTLSVGGKMINKLSQEAVDVLQQLASVCRLQTLTLEIGQMVSYHQLYRGNFRIMSNEYDLSAIEAFVQNAFRMKHLYLKTWPIISQDVISDKRPSVFTALLNNDKLKDLESIDFFWCDSNVWSERLPVLPSPEMTITLVSHFQRLTTLSLRSPMMNEDLLKILAKTDRAKLKELKIFMQHHDMYDNYNIPNISSDTWKEFTRCNPGVWVHCKICTRIKHIDLANLLKPDCPLASITFMQYSMLDSESLNAMADMYHSTLCRFACYCNITSSSEELVNFVSKCTKLNHFSYFGEINNITLITLAELRCSNWKEFLFQEKNVKYIDDEDEFQDVDDDCVIARNAQGEFYQVDIARFFGTDSRQLQLKDEMQQRIKTALNKDLL